jgi:hypothetical protein
MALQDLFFLRNYFFIGFITAVLFFYLSYVVENYDFPVFTI